MRKRKCVTEVLVDSDDVVICGFKNSAGLQLVASNDFPPRGRFCVDVEDSVGKISFESALPEPERMVDVLESQRERFLIEGSHREPDVIPSTCTVVNESGFRNIEGLGSIRIRTKWGPVFPRNIHPAVLHRSIGIVKKAPNHSKVSIFFAKIFDFFKKF